MLDGGTMYSCEMDWDGNKLKSFDPSYTNWNPFYFQYDDEGRRVKKTTEGFIVTEYYYEGDLLVAETGYYHTILFMYDASGAPIGMLYHATDTTSAWEVFWYEKKTARRYCRRI